jgi:hypothetical protein
MTLSPLLPLLSLFFVFIYKYKKLLGVSSKIQKIEKDPDVSDVRKINPPIYIHADNSCLYNHNNLCQKMAYID